MKKHIVIVGAGSAGWITLSYLISTLPEFEYTIIYDSDIDAIGIGESTTPTIKHVAETVGVNEIDWLKDSKATIKYGIVFDNWNGDNKSWFHSFEDLIPGNLFFDPPSDISKNCHSKPDSVELSLELYKKLGLTNKEYNDIHGPQHDMAELGVSPFSKSLRPTIGQWPGYAYHINAQLFGQSLKNSIDQKNRKYNIINDQVIDFIQDTDGNVVELITKSNETIKCDFVFDCTGFSRNIIGKLSTFVEYEDMICNSAIAGTVEITDHPLYTKASAQPYGWIWETPTYGRMGSGYVYSDKFISHEQAELDFKSYWKEQGKDVNIVRKFKFKSGRMKDICVNNVISNGLGQSFIEPLEATSIMITCATVIKFVESYNRHNQKWNRRISCAFSKFMDIFLEHTKHFVKYHYTLTKRSDTDFWKYWNQESIDNDSIRRYNEYIQKHLSTSTFLNKGETIINQFNLTSMLIGMEHPCLFDTTVTYEQLNRFRFVSRLNRLNYQNLIKDNLSHNDFLDQIQKSKKGIDKKENNK
jgi:tryptophan halogenase